MQTLGVRWSGWFSREHWQWVPRGISELSVGGSNLTSMGYRKRNVPPLFLSPPPSTQQSFTLWGGGGGGRPKIQPFTLLYALLYDRKGTLFVYLPLTNDATCTYVLLNAPPLLTAVNVVFFKIWKTKQNTTRKFFWLSFTAINSSLSLLGLFTDVKTNFPTLSYTSTS